jgi:tetratricopeptide (TPR) repeat protein
VALVELALGGEAPESALRPALGALEAACRRDRDDGRAGEARGQALMLLGRRAEALAAFEAVLARAPERELALAGAAAVAEALGRAEDALGYWRRVVAADPWAPKYRRWLALLLVRRRAWGEAEPACRAWVRLDPTGAEARAALVECLLAAGRTRAARAEFARVEALAPPNLREPQIRLGRRLRPANPRPGGRIQ